MNKKLLKLIIKYLNKPKFLFGLGLSFIGTIMSLFIPQFMGNLLNEEFLITLISNPITIAVSIVSLLLVFSVQASSRYVIGLCGSQAVNKLQKHIYASLLATSVKELENHPSGDVASRLTNDMSVILNFITSVLPNLILNGIVIMGSLYFLVNISLPLTLLSLLLFPILLFIIIPINHRLESYYTSYQEGLGDISGRISHRFTHIRLMKSFNGEKSEEESMAHFFNQLTHNFKKIIGLSSIQNTLSNGLTMTFIILLLVVAGLEVSKGNMTMSTLMTFILYLTQLIDPITDISESMTDWTEFQSVSNRLMEMVELDKEVGGEKGLELSGSSIIMKNVNFSYDQENVLNDLSVNIQAGQHTAIVGPSGAGKSTIFALLMKFYQNYKGEILIGSQNLADLSEEQLRNMVAYIPQDNILFHGTIRENLLYGKNKIVSEERMNEVLEELGLVSLIRDLDKGLDTEISDSGTGLSEGQKQRFNIARALLLEHPIYLLDEVTASLDSVTEQRISKAIDKLTAGKTRMTIAHRLHTVKKADPILVLDKTGQIVDQGTHHQLLLRNQLYQEFLSNVQRAG